MCFATCYFSLQSSNAPCRAEGNYDDPWVLGGTCCTVGGNTGYAFFGPSDADCLEDVTFVDRSDQPKEDTGTDTFTVVCDESDPAICKPF